MKKLTILQSIFRSIQKKFESADEECTLLEIEVSETIEGALRHADTTLMTSIYNKKYLIVNPTLHLTISINQNSAMIRITNTIHNTAEKYRVAFVDDIVEKIINDYDKRMDNICENVDHVILNLIKNTNSMIKIANGDLNEQVGKVVKEMVEETFSNDHKVSSNLKFDKVVTLSESKIVQG